MVKQYYVYILANEYNTVFYIGVTNNLERRMFEHKQGLVKGFTQHYKVKKLVYIEACFDVNAAIAREKQLKNWRRQWKIDLVKATNPKFQDLAVDLLGDAESSSA